MGKLGGPGAIASRMLLNEGDAARDRGLCGWGGVLAMALVCLRVMVQTTWGRLALSNADLAAFRVPQLACALVVAGSILLIVTRDRPGNVVGCAALALCIAIVQVSSAQCKSDDLAIDLLLLFVVSHEDPQRLCRAYGLTLLLSVALLMLGSLAGLVFMADDIPNGRLVYAYGFGHPNSPGGLMLSAVGALTYAYWDDDRWPVTLVLSAACATFAKLFLSSNSSSALIAAFACMNAVGHAMPGRRLWRLPRKAFVAVLLVVPAVLASLMILLTVDYDRFPRLAEVMNNLTHLRPVFANYYAETNGGPALFGRPYVSVSHFHNGSDFASVDCAYSFLVLVFGLAAFAACVLVYVRAVERLSRSEVRVFVMLSIVIYAVYAVVETCPLNLYSNFTLLLLACPPPARRGSHESVAHESVHDRLSGTPRLSPDAEKGCS